ncbi:MAG: hypothetical protein LBS58_00140 [Coriobacteriales bacterium]|jgi:hypothetical protein|nr:hypothetical protein [Coriobacteriales bacterium]
MTDKPADGPDLQAILAEEIKLLPRISLGALFMPAIWGPAHGYWVTILFYPIWLFADNCFISAYLYGGLAIPLAIATGIGTAAVTIGFALTAGPHAWMRVASRIRLDRYLKREKIWAVASALIALAFFAFATWYNLAYRLVA